MVLSGNVWFFKVILKCEILLWFIYVLARKGAKSSMKSRDVWRLPRGLSGLLYVFLLSQYGLSQLLISLVG